MLLNDLCKVADEVGKIQKTLENAPYQFFLTGSRFFGNTHSGSDWDYFTQYSIPCKAFLLDNGFKQDKAAYYGVNTIQGLNIVLKKGLIHVQLVKDVNFKRIVQSIIKKRIDPKELKCKQAAKRVWDKYALQVREVLDAQKLLV